ncbi:MAG: proline--tRNA ligase [Lactobacillaceae bacterium]|jgi:prolyl-tRNA synthetase|nr:proline--tRNA ligase [Lactobacillaceae bacterium]
MKMSQLLGKRFKEKPSDTKLKSHELLIRGGYIRPVSNGIFSSLLPSLKTLKNVEKIVREEMNAISGQEVEMPLVQPKELWEESGRYFAINDELARLKDRTGRDFVLAMTHEEATVALARTEATSYKDFPFMIYQFAKKFRDEARPRGGLIRVKEFTMKDAYSFHTNKQDLEDYYNQCAVAYGRIFARAGIPETVAIKSDSGMMGGSVSHEYMLLTEAGEDTIVTCSKCDYRANKEIAESVVSVENDDEAEKPIEKVSTPNTESIEDLAKFFNVPESKFAKTIFYKPTDKISKPVLVMIRGDIEVNENKLAKVIQSMPELADDAAINAVGAVVGYASAYGIENKCYVVVDKTLVKEKNLITGANEKDYHIKNFNVGRDLSNPIIADVAAVREGDKCIKCGSPLELHRGIEVGNIFQLGDKYTKSMEMRYTDESGSLATPIMGCYGIGIGRLMASVLEVRNDDKGPIWPVSIAPWKVAVLSLLPKDGEGEIMEVSKKIYEELARKGIDTIWDERKLNPGEKFADADLLGTPLHLVISQRNIENGQVEWKERATGNKGFVSAKDVVSFAENWVKEELQKLNAAADMVKPLPLEELSN